LEQATEIEQSVAPIAPLNNQFSNDGNFMQQFMKQSAPVQLDDVSTVVDLSTQGFSKKRKPSIDNPPATKAVPLGKMFKKKTGMKFSMKAKGKDGRVLKAFSMDDVDTVEEPAKEARSEGSTGATCQQSGKHSYLLDASLLTRSPQSNT
jgi:hypothetical protein